MKKIVAILMAMILVMSMTVVLGSGAAPTKEKQSEKVDQQIFENKELNVLDEERFVADEILVKFKPGVGKEKMDKINSKHGAFVRHTSPYSGTKRIAIPKGKTVAEMVKLYQAEDAVEYAEPNYIAHALMVPNDPYYGYQWHLDNAEYGGIGMEKAWDISTGLGVTIAIVDTGIAQGTDLADTCFVAGYDFVNDDSDPIDDNGHGTHVAGTVAQSTNNGIGVAGVAFNACLMPVKVLDSSGSGYYSDVADGIIWAADNGAKVISLSLGGSAASDTLKNAVAYAYNAEVTVIAAAGNDASPSLSYPAAYDDFVIAVGATRYDETLAYYSNYGPSLDLVAPGGDLNVDQNNDGYADGVLQQTFQRTGGSWRITWGYYFFQGTSMATPHVSGVAALLISKGVATTPDEVRETLQSTAEDKGPTGWDPEYGWGIVDAYAALQFSFGPKSPVADAGPDQTLSDADNDNVEEVTLNGSASYDPDGSIVAYKWKEGETVLGTAEVVTYNFTVGTHNVTLTITDNDSLTDSDEVIITVEANKAPTADAGPDQSAYVNETVTFDGSGSTDPDGKIYSYEWDFGDGTNGTGVTTTHVYGTTGTYTVVLTVTDNGGLTDTDTAIVTVTEAPAYLTMHVHGIDMSLSERIAGRNTFTHATALVTIVNATGALVEGATVEGHWSNSTSDSDSGTTNADGQVSLDSDEVKNAPIGTNFTFTVDSVTKEGWTYDPTANEETSDNITV